MAVLRPLKLVIDNYPEGMVEEFEVENNPRIRMREPGKYLFQKFFILRRTIFAKILRRNISAWRPVRRLDSKVLI